MYFIFDKNMLASEYNAFYFMFTLAYPYMYDLLFLEKLNTLFLDTLAGRSHLFSVQFQREHVLGTHHFL